MADLVSRFERRYRADHIAEHALLISSAGQVVSERAGTFDSVTFDPAELERARGGALTHSHPRSLSVSGADLSLAARYGLTLRAIGQAPDTGESFDHTVRFERPDPALADVLPARFAAAVDRAEKELARAPLADLAWQREARHVAVTRLAHEHSFAYQRTLYGSLSETARHETARLDVLGSADGLIRQQVFAPLAANLIRDLVHLAHGGIIPMASLAPVRAAVSRQVQRTMLGAPHSDGSLAPYVITHGTPAPHSVYFRVLYASLRSAAAAAATRHADLMRRYLPADIVRSLEFAALSPFDTTLAEDEAPQYDPLHLWLGPDGKRLSDRIWQAAGEMRTKLDAYLTQAIAQRLPVEDMAKGLEQFLLEGTGGYEALRLARTETAAAYHRADALAAGQNPLVETYSPFVAPDHKCCDECDGQAANAPYPKANLRHLPPFHANCICGVLWNMVDNVKAVVIRLRAQIERAIGAAQRAFTDYIGPISRKFVALLFRGRS